MANISGKGFLLTTKFYKSLNDTSLFTPEKWNIEGREAVKNEDTEI